MLWYHNLFNMWKNLQQGENEHNKLNLILKWVLITG